MTTRDPRNVSGLMRDSQRTRMQSEQLRALAQDALKMTAQTLRNVEQTKQEIAIVAEEHEENRRQR